MRTKRYISLFLAAFMVLVLPACGAKDGKEDDSTAMTIQPAQLSEEEIALMELLALDMDSYHIYDFQADGAKTLQISAYELVDGEWSLLWGGGGAELSEESGRIALTLGKMTDGARVAFHTGIQIMSTSVQPEPEDDVSGMAFGTSTLDNTVEVELEREIPLALQVATSKNELRMYQVDYFGMPRELAKNGYEHVYAITVRFSQKSLSELYQDAPAAPPAEPSPAE